MRLLIVLLGLISSSLLAQKLTPEILISEAESFIAQNKHAEALRSLNACIERFPSVTYAYQLRSNVQEDLGKHSEALTDLNMAVELSPESSEILLNRALLAFKLKRYDLAKPDFRRLLSIRSSETNTVYFRQSNNEGVDNIMTAQSNIHDQLYNYLGLIEFQLGELNSAIILFDSAIAINKKQPDYFAHRGLAVLKQGTTELAAQDFNHALLLNPDHAVSKNNLATIKRNEGKIAEAEKLLYEAKLANAKAQHHHAGLALLQMESSRYAEAILNLDTAILIEPTDGELYLNRGLANEKLNNLNGAMSDCSKAIQIDEHWAKAWFVQGNIYLKQNHWNEALENYNMAITLDDNYSLAYYNRAIIYMRLGKKKSACEDILKAEKGMPVDRKAKASMCSN